MYESSPSPNLQSAFDSPAYTNANGEGVLTGGSARPHWRGPGDWAAAEAAARSARTVTRTEEGMVRIVPTSRAVNTM